MSPDRLKEFKALLNADKRFRLAEFEASLVRVYDVRGCTLESTQVPSSPPYEMACIVSATSKAHEGAAVMEALMMGLRKTVETTMLPEFTNEILTFNPDPRVGYIFSMEQPVGGRRMPDLSDGAVFSSLAGEVLR